MTTPQDLALIDAKKGIEMFNKVNIPVLGVVENMAVHICSNCGHSEHLFGEGGGTRIAEQFGVDLLGALPLSMMSREQVDGGTPTVVAEPDSQITMIYRDMARRLAAELSLKNSQAQPRQPSVLRRLTTEQFREPVFTFCKNCSRCCWVFCPFCKVPASGTDESGYTPGD